MNSEMSLEMVLLQCAQARKLADDSIFVTVIGAVLLIVMAVMMLEYVSRRCVMTLRPKHRVFVERF